RAGPSRAGPPLRLARRYKQGPRRLSGFLCVVERRRRRHPDPRASQSRIRQAEVAKRRPGGSKYSAPPHRTSRRRLVRSKASPFWNRSRQKANLSQNLFPTLRTKNTIVGDRLGDSFSEFHQPERHRALREERESIAWETIAA